MALVYNFEALLKIHWRVRRIFRVLISLKVKFNMINMASTLVPHPDRVIPANWHIVFFWLCKYEKMWADFCHGHLSGHLPLGSYPA